MKTLLILAFTILLGTGVKSPDSNTNESLMVMSEMIIATKSVKTAKFALENTERIDKTLLTGKQKVTINSNPFSCYVQLIAPKKGAELLYVSGQNDGDAIYEPNGMPYVQMKLDPKGYLLRQNNHHTIFELGFSYMSSVLDYYFKESPGSFSIVEKTTFDGKPGTVLKIEFDNYAFHDYTVKANESAETIANRLFLSKYKIIEINRAVSGFEIIKPGTVIKLPSHYAKKIEIFIDDRTRLPLRQRIFDEKGLFEQYLYTEVEINPYLPQGFFSVKNLGKSM